MTSDYRPKSHRIELRVRSPRQPEDRWPAKAYLGEVVPFTATIFTEGRDTLEAELELTAPSGVRTTHPMSEAGSGTDLWTADVQLDEVGLWQFTIRACSAVATRSVAHGSVANSSVANKGTAKHSTESAGFPLRVERTRAGVGSWYEFFPRSEGAKHHRDGSWTSGTFRTAAHRLPQIAELGFDVVYLPPIHPIGTSFRKGKNNTETAEPNDPGSPWAIGSASGGHDAIHPDLGTEKDFRAFVASANKLGLELALDLALQCSPDHPWVSSHPEWFTHRADGTIAYAENPPKKYQDIYPLNFDNDPVGLREEILRIVNHWIKLGVTIFRVDNPHTKPLPFWEWLLHEVEATHPEIVFLAEAFTRPELLHALAQVGFQQSYTYFTWRNTKEELASYLTELSHETSDFLRPNLFVNTPDILTEYLQFGGVPAYKIRAAIAATASPSWGVYSGYELIENVARPGAEENIDNEKYEYRPRDWSAALKGGKSIAPYLGLLNRIRAEHPALWQLRNLQVHASDDDAILVYSKYLSAQFTESRKPDAIIVVANVDPHAVRETTVHLELPKIGLPVGETFEVTDLITDQKFTWGADNYVRLDAFAEPAHILRVEFQKGK